MNNSNILLVIIVILTAIIGYLVGMNKNSVNAVNGVSLNDGSYSSAENQQNKLTQDEWLNQYLKAKEECNKEVKVKPPEVMLGPNDDIGLYNYKIQLAKDEEAQKLLLKKYPELCKYLDIPEYRDKLNQYNAQQAHQAKVDFQNSMKMQEWNNVMNEQDMYY